MHLIWADKDENIIPVSVLGVMLEKETSYENNKGTHNTIAFYCM